MTEPKFPGYMIRGKINGIEYYWTAGVSKKLPLFSADKREGFIYHDKARATSMMDSLKDKKIFMSVQEWTLIPLL